jgi:hypothetical protein
MDGLTTSLEVADFKDAHSHRSTNNPSELELNIRISKITGRPVLYFPYMAISDIHWGSRFTRAKRLCMALRDFESDELKILGDTVGGVEMTKKKTWHMGPWHRQGIALVLQKTKISAVTNLDGNHEAGLDRFLRTPKHLYGIELRKTSTHRDPKGRLFLEEHGDDHDRHVFKTPESQAWWYSIGDSLLNIGGEVDLILQDKLRLENASVARAAKRLFKTLINKKMGVLAAMEREIDASHYDGNVSGHSHMGGFHYTPGGKLLINDGCCTDHVQFVVHDRHGNWALIEHHRDRMIIEMENGTKYTKIWKELELDHFSAPPREQDNIYTERADRLLRLASHLWPSRDRQKLNEEIVEQNHVIERLLKAAAVEVAPECIVTAIEEAKLRQQTLCMLRRQAPYSARVSPMKLAA